MNELEWTFVDDDSRRLAEFVEKHPAPRPYGVFDEVRATPAFLWMTVGSTVLWRFTHSQWWLMILIALFAYAATVLARRARLRREGFATAVATAEVKSLDGEQHDPEALDVGITHVDLPGRPQVELAVPLERTRALIEEHGAVELWVLYHEDAPSETTVLALRGKPSAPTTAN